MPSLRLHRGAGLVLYRVSPSVEALVKGAKLAGVIVWLRFRDTRAAVEPVSDALFRYFSAEF